MNTEIKETTAAVAAPASDKSKGRPVVATSKRQQRLAEKAARAAVNGGVVKRGRPSTKKVETAPTEA
jgi:hypothetical protein